MGFDWDMDKLAEILSSFVGEEKESTMQGSTIVIPLKSWKIGISAEVSLPTDYLTPLGRLSKLNAWKEVEARY